MAPALLQAVALALRAASLTCPTAPTCPQDDQCSYMASGVLFQVSCGTDYYGGDLELAHTSTVAACIKTCSTTTSCIAVSYVYGNCYMKSALNSAVVNANVISAAVMSREVLAAADRGSSQQTCPESFTCPENNGCSYTTGSRTLILSCGMDFYGGDSDNQYAESLEACTQACAANTECVAASFVGGKGTGTCYLKSTKNDGNMNDNVNGVYVAVASAGSSPSATLTTSIASSSTLAETSSSIEASIGISSSALLTSDVQFPSSDTVAISTSLITSSVASTTTTSTVEISTKVVSSSTISPSSAASSADLSSSTITSTSTVLVSSSPSPTSIVANGGFEAANSIPWTIKTSAPGVITYSFANSNSPHSGVQAASVGYSVGASAYQAWFNQPINLQPNARYILSAWTKASTSNPGCSISFYVGTANGNQNLKTLAMITSVNLKPSWTQSTGFYDNGASGDTLTFNVRWTCTSAAARTYYIDDISLVRA